MGGSVSDLWLALVDVTRDEDDEWILDKGGLRSAARGEEELSAALKTTHTRVRALAATKAEIEKAAILDEQLRDVLRDVTDCKTRSAELELEKAKATTSRKTIELLRAMKDRDIRDVIRSVSAAESVDLAFVVDATGSMGRHIDNVKKSIKDIVERVKGTNSDLRLRLAVVAYRDLSDGSDRSQVLDFGESVDAFESFLHGLHAKGGGDAPEDMALGIQLANGLSWSNPTRVVFIVADHPCHGSLFHGFADDYPSGTPGIDIISELRNLESKNAENGSTTLFFGRLTDHTDRMIARFGEDGISLQIVSFNDSSKVVTAVTKGVRSSIFKTMTVRGTGMKSIAFTAFDLKSRAASTRATAKLKRYSVDPELPRIDEWARRPAVSVKVYRSRAINSMEDLKAPFEFGIVSIRRGARTDKTDASTMLLRCAEEPFAEGETRISFRGQLAPTEAEMANPKSAMVLKSFKHMCEGVNDLKQYLKQMEVPNIAFYLSKEYNKSFRRDHCSQVHFLQVCVVEDLDETKEDQGARRYCAEQPLPSKEFTQFSNNTGFWNHDCLDETHLRFTEFTYQATNGYLMVTDLQGVRKGDEYTLTDPVVLCKDVLRFGSTNLGEAFMKKCINATWAIMKEKGW